MPARRILSLWFPRLAAERLLRRLAMAGPFAVVAEAGQVQRLVALSAAAEAAGLARGQPLRDAMAACPDLVTRPADPAAEAAFLAALARWAGRLSPWVALAPPDGLTVDLTGCAHLFGGEAALVERVAADCGDLGLTLRAAVADTPGAAWALARFGGAAAPAPLSGDAIRQEARATRARAADRRAPAAPVPAAGGGAVIAPPGETHAALAPLPPAALRIGAETAAELARLGLRRIGDLAGMPRAALARRFGHDLMRRLDQALGRVPEPVSALPPPQVFAVRMSLPEPIGREADIAAALDRMLPRLCARLAEKGRGARRLRLQAFRADGGVSAVEIGLARPGREPAALRGLLALKLDRIEAGFGIDLLRLSAPLTEPVAPRQHPGPAAAGEGVGAAAGPADGLADLIGRLGARIGLEAITRLAPADSHIPEKAQQVLAAAWAPPAAGPWPEASAPRPLILLARPEPVEAGPGAAPPERFRWRRQALVARTAEGPERIAPEWWLDDPAWRSGVRDYWRVETGTGARLWLFYAHGGAVSGGWFCHGMFA